jgi:hypothetical protein
VFEIAQSRADGSDRQWSGSNALWTHKIAAAVPGEHNGDDQDIAESMGSLIESMLDHVPFTKMKSRGCGAIRD